MSEIIKHILENIEEQDREELIKQQELIDQLKKEHDDKVRNSFSSKLLNLDPDNLFQFLAIIVVTVFLFTRLRISMNMIFGLITGLLVVYFIYDRKQVENASNLDKLKIKQALIRPKPENFDGHPELVEFFYSIRDFFDYNPQAFRRVVKNVDAFLKILHDIRMGVRYCQQNMDVAKDKMDHALNHLHSIIFKLPVNKMIQDKLFRATEELQLILTNYQMEMIKICNLQLKERGYNVERGYTHFGGARPYDHFLDHKYSFKIYWW